jgi:ankyrin repeat protein
LHWASSDYEDLGLSMVKFLLEKGVDVNALCEGGRSPLPIAISRDNQSVAALLFTHGADVSVLNESERERERMF